MITGTEFWDTARFSDMASIDIETGSVFTYKQLPASMYHSLSASVAQFPEKTALVDDGNCDYTYRRLLEMTDGFAAFLSARYSLSYGARAALVFHSGIEFCVALFALSRLGAVAVLLPNKYKQAELLPLITKSKAGLILCDPEFEDWFSAAGVPVLAVQQDHRDQGFADPVHAGNTGPEPAGRRDSDALIMFTSGTTAGTKAVLLKNYRIMHAILSYQRILNITPEDRSVIPIPIYTVTGTIANLGLLLHVGATIFLHKKFDPRRVLECAAENRLTFLHASPTVFTLLLDHREEFPAIPSLRAFACGSSNMPVENILKLQDWLPDAAFHTVYGLTETASPATVFPCGAAGSPYIGSSGLPIPGVSVKIIADDGEERETGEMGEVALRGSVVIERYLLGGEDSFTADGWLKTGDLGYLNQEGYLFIADRKKDVINRGGEKICSYEVENAIHSIAGVAEAAVVSIPHRLYGEQPVAVVRPEQGCTITEQQIKEALAARLAKFKIPVRIRFTEGLLKTANGKIDKQGLRKWFAESAAEEIKNPPEEIKPSLKDEKELTL